MSRFSPLVSWYFIIFYSIRDSFFIPYRLIDLVSSASSSDKLFICTKACPPITRQLLLVDSKFASDHLPVTLVTFVCTCLYIWSACCVQQHIGFSTRLQWEKKGARRRAWKQPSKILAIFILPRIVLYLKLFAEAA